jgi:ribonuclease HII
MRMKLLCGIDEAGRGPLAGPVTAAAVILPDSFPKEILRDSKKLSAAKREAVLSQILMRGVAFGIGWSWPEEIDRINILQASLLAMRRAFLELPRQPGSVIVDGNRIPDLPVPCEAVVKADNTVPEVMAASIIAKVVRDRWMIRYSWFEPEYGYERHKGYPTREHRETCLRLGPSPIQRLSFRIS